MLRINAFEAIRPRPDLAEQVASVPYDVVNRDEAREFAEGNPHSFLRVVRSDLELPDDVDPYSDAVYEKAAANFNRMLDEGVLVRDRKPGLYLYRQAAGPYEQVGVVACCHVDDYHQDIIKKHEKTRKAKEDDRTRHVLTINANSGPVFLTYRDRPAVEESMEQDMAGSPLFNFTAPDGVQHTGWAVENPEAYLEAFKDVPAAYVADGHHRAASAARAGKERQKHNPNHTGDEEYNWFLAVLFPAGKLNILAYNRVVRDLAGQSPDDVLKKLSEAGTLSETDQPEPDRAGVFCIYLGGRWHRLELDPASIDRDDPIAGLDVALVEERILRPILKIDDARTDERIDFVGGIRGTGELEKRVDSGESAIAISMHPTSIEQLLAVSDAGLIMPPKSTWFEPKLRSGLFIHSLD